MTVIATAEKRAARSAVAFWQWIAADPVLSVALFILAVLIFFALFAPYVAPFDPELPDPSARLAKPFTGGHLFGADVNGFDIFSRVIHAPRIDLLIAVSSTLLALAAGVVLGLLGSFFQGIGGISGFAAELLNRLMDIIQSFPVFIVALALVGVLGTGTDKVIYVLAFLFMPIFFRFVRAEVLTVRERLFVEAEIAVGNPLWRVVFVNVMRNSIGPAVVQASPNMGYAILLTAGLSFLGAGVRPPTPEWGAMIAAGQEQLYNDVKWWPAVFPGIAVGLAVFSLAVVGESLRKRLER